MLPLSSWRFFFSNFKITACCEPESQHTRLYILNAEFPFHRSYSFLVKTSVSAGLASIPVPRTAGTPCASLTEARGDRHVTNSALAFPTHAYPPRWGFAPCGYITSAVRARTPEAASAPRTAASSSPADSLRHPRGRRTARQAIAPFRGQLCCCLPAGKYFPIWKRLHGHEVSQGMQGAVHTGAEQP